MNKINFSSLYLNREKRNLFFYTCGLSISLLGSAIYSFTMGLHILKITGSSLSFATNILLYTLPVIFIFPIAGVITDRINRKKIIIGSDLLSFLFLLFIYIISRNYSLKIPLIYLSTFILNLLASFNNISLEAVKPEIVSNNKIININSISKIASSSSNILGPVIGGIVYAFLDIKYFIIINSICFLMAAILEYCIDYKYNKNNITINEEKKDSKKSSLKDLYSDMVIAYNYICTRKTMKGFIYVFIILNFFTTFSFTVPVPYLMNTIWEIKPEYFGIIEGGLPIGMLLGALSIKRIMKKITYSKLLKLTIPVLILETVFFSLPLFIWNVKPGDIFILLYYGILMFIIGILISYIDIPIMVILQQTVPGNLLGRVISITISIVKVVVPISLLLSGFLINNMSPIYLFLSGGVVLAIFNLLFFSSSLADSLSRIEENTGIFE